MLVAWHPTRWWIWCMSEDKKKEIKLFFIVEKQYKAVDIFDQYKTLEMFD